MQIDFCGEGGYVDEMNYDITLTRAPIRPISDTLNDMRKSGITLFTLARVIEMISQISRIINVGGRKKLVRVSGIRVHAENSNSRRTGVGDYTGIVT